MKWAGRIAGILGCGILIIGLVLVLGRSLWARQLLSYYAGSEVWFDSLSLTWLGGDRWQAHFQNIRIASTEPSIPFAPLKAQKVVLTFQGVALQGVEAEGASFILIRQKKGAQIVRNYQRLFPKRGEGRPVSLKISIRKALFHLLNQPAALEVQAQVERAAGVVNIDSVWIDLVQTGVDVGGLGICYRGQAYEGLYEGRVSCTGRYRKVDDSWASAFLRVYFPGLGVLYEGKIRRWASLEGGMQMWVDSTLLRRWVALPSFAKMIMGGDVRASVLFEGDTVFFHTWGEGEWGQYEVCGRWGARGWGQLEGMIWNGPAYSLRAKSEEGDSWRVWGQGWYQGYPWWAEAHLRDLSQAGEVLFQFGAVRGRYSGSLRRGRGLVRWRELVASVEWDEHQGLIIKLDTVAWGNLSRFLEGYRPLWQGARGISFPWKATIQHLSVTKGWLLRALEFASRGKYFEGQGELCYLSWDICLSLKGRIERGGRIGHLSGCSADGKVCGCAEWWGDSVSASVAGLLGGPYYGQIRGRGSLSQRRFWVEAGQLQSAAGSYLEARGVFSDSMADGTAWGEVLIPEILIWLPLTGMEIREGYLSGKVCFQEAWQTLFSWDNHAEGWTRLSRVSGNFVKVGLPLILDRVQVVFDPDATHIEGLQAEVGDIRLSGAATVQGTLGYIYEDWRALRGQVSLFVERFRLLDVWRVRRGDTYVPRLLLPEKMTLHAEIAAKDVDIFGFGFDSVSVEGSLQEQTIRLDKVGALYRGGKLNGWGLLDAMDTACYIAGWQVKAEGIPVQGVLAESGLDRVPAIGALGIQGAFSGEIQAAIRFAPNLTWRENSTLVARGSVSKGLFCTPSFFRWIRPFFIAAYRDSMDFLAQLSELSIVGSYLQLHRSLVVTRMAAFTIEGIHLLSEDRFLYRMQGTRVFRKAQRYPHLERLSPYLVERLAGSLWLLYIEKKDGRVRWRYPVKYLLRRLVTG